MLLHSPAWCRIQIGTDTDVRYEPLSDRIPNRIASSAAQFNHILSVIAARRRDKTLLLAEPAFSRPKLWRGSGRLYAVQ